MKRLSISITLAVTLATLAHGYPLDQHERTGIDRLEWQLKINRGEIKGRKSDEGARWPSQAIKLRMADGKAKAFDLTSSTSKDPKLQAALDEVLRKGGFTGYGIALLDITDPTKPRFAANRETIEQTPGSVAKVLPATALLAQAARLYPDVKAREAFLKRTSVAADRWAMPNGHQVPAELVGGRVRYRPVRMGDRFTLWQWLDHALSISSNAAATMVWREATLMKLLGKEYPPADYGEGLWRRWSKAAFSEAAFAAIDGPLEAARLSSVEFRLRAFFTGGAIRYIHRSISRTSPLAMVRWLLRVEQGRIVDDFTSLELKRLLYVTTKRMRYAFSKELRPSAVYFKSGSLFECKPEKKFRCGKYMGNKLNVLNSMTTVETLRGSKPPVVYIVGVMSNVLKRNASDDHAKLGAMIQQMMIELHSQS